MRPERVVADQEHSAERVVRRLDGEQQLAELQRSPVTAALTQRSRVPEQRQKQRPAGRHGVALDRRMVLTASRWEARQNTGEVNLTNARPDAMGTMVAS